MKSESVGAINNQIRRVKRAARVSLVLGPVLLVGLIELVAHRKELSDSAYWFLFLVSIVIFATLCLCVASLFRSILPTKVTVTEAPQGVTAESPLRRKLLFRTVVLGVLGLAFFSGRVPFGSWQEVDASVILRVLVFPAVSVWALASIIKRLSTVFEANRPIRPRIRTTSSQVIWLFYHLMLFAIFLSGCLGIAINLRSGITYSPWTFGPFEFGARVDRKFTPEAYWAYIEVYIFLVLIALVIAVQQMYEFISIERKRNSSSGDVIWISGMGMIFFTAILIVGRYLYLSLMLWCSGQN